MKKNILTSILLLLCFFTGYAQEATNSTGETVEDTPRYANHIGTMWDLSISKNWGFMTTGIQQSVFTIDTEMERAMSILSFDVPIISRYLHFNALGFYLYYRMSQGDYRHMLRYHAGLSGAVPTRYINFTWAGRYESTYILGNESPINKLRARVRIVGNIPNSKFQPFIGSEFFLVLNNANAGRGERLWYDIGVTYNIDKNNKVEFLIREEQMMLTTPLQWNTNIGFAYKVTL